MGSPGIAQPWLNLAWMRLMSSGNPGTVCPIGLSENTSSHPRGARSGCTSETGEPMMRAFAMEMDE